MTNVTPMMEPDAVAMLRHLEHLFGGDLDGCQDGLVEIAWTDAASGRLQHARLFGTDDLDEAAEFAASTNRIPGQNIYLGAALRKADTPPFGRCDDTDFLALPAFYVDLDAAGTADTAKTRYRGCPPTLAVVTGRHPHVRVQLWWRHESPERDPSQCRRQNQALAQAFDGDAKVINPSRVMRLAGSVAWPSKPGRVLERTELRTFGDGRPTLYLPGQLAKAFPPVEIAEPPRQVDAPAQGHSIGSASQGVGVSKIMAQINSGDHWHDNMVRLVGHWIARGWSDAEIIAAAESLTLPGWTADQTRAEVVAMIAGGRAKWAVPNPDHAMEEDFTSTPPFNLLDWTAERYAGTPKPITWLCRGTIPLGVPGLLAAMGGIGKSFIALDLTLHIAAGLAGLEQPKLFLGGRLDVDGTAVILTAEDGFNAIHRRLDRIDPRLNRLRNPRRLIIMPLPDAGGPMPLIASDGKTLVRTPAFNVLKQQLLALPDLRLVVIDPLQAFVLADVNADPAAAQFMWSALAELATATGATVLATHHMRKDGGFNIRTGDDAREAIRGTTALVDGGRFTYALWKLDSDEAETIADRLGIVTKPGDICRGALVKANDEADFSLQTYIRNEAGLLEQKDLQSDDQDSAERTRFSMTKAREILTEVQRRFEGGTPFSHAPNSGPRCLLPYLIRQHGMSRMAAQNLLADWMNNTVLTVDVCDRKTKMSGLRVVKWL